MMAEQMHVEVAIVGGGLAGLSAARSLSRQKHAVVVLEARERLGGRIESHRLPDGSVVDLGAQWHGPGQDRVLSLIRELELRTYETFTHGRTAFEFNGNFGRYRGAMPVSKALSFFGAAWGDAQLGRLVKQLEQEKTWGTPLTTRLDSRSLGDWVRERVWPEDARSLVRFMLESLFCCDADDVSLLHAAFSIGRCGSLGHMLRIQGGAQERQFSLGAEALIRAVAADVEAQVRLGCPVERIEHDANGAVLSGPGFEVLAKQVVIAIPPQLVASIAFRPELGQARRALISQLHMGSVIKCVAVYPRPFWREQGLSGEAWSISGPLNGTYDTTPPESDQGVLTALVAASSATSLQRSSPSERKKVVLATIAKLLGEAAAAPLHYVERVWKEEAWTGGGYTVHVGPGSFAHGFDALRQQEGVLHWAGTETATSWPGYMEGALESAERVVREIAASARDFEVRPEANLAGDGNSIAQVGVRI